MIKIEIALSLVKEALRIDYDDEDTFLNLCLESAKGYIEDAIDDYETKIEDTKFQNKAKIAIISIVQDMFYNRVYSNAANMAQSEKTRYIIASLMAQMRYA